MDGIKNTGNTPIMVSVICNAYNHERFIEEALRSFVMQKTDFAFEVLVHDDASTDGTAEIIREYTKKYPELIKPILQSENQYSKGVSINWTYQYPRAAGRYIAVCEGDDFWTDPLKLQKQFDLMEEHPECDMCAHGSAIVSGTTGEVTGHVMRLEKTGVIPAARIIDGGGGSFLMTNSLFYRHVLAEDMPPFRKMLDYDYTLQIHGALRGGLLYIAEEMSAYRAGASGSWTVRMKRDCEKRRKHYRRVNAALRRLDRDTHGKYRLTILKLRLKNLAKQAKARLQGMKKQVKKA